jgi:hypothetical protein
MKPKEGGAARPQVVNNLVAADNIEIDVPKSPQEGRNAPISNSPIYGDIGQLDPTKKTLAEAPEPVGETKAIATVGADREVTPAILRDRPKRNTDQGSAFDLTFETAALGMIGQQAGNYLGSISWGWTWAEGQDTSTLKAIDLVSPGAPSASFYKAATAWNRGTIKGFVNPAPEPKAQEGKKSEELPKLDPEIAARLQAAVAMSTMRRRAPRQEYADVDTIKLPAVASDAARETISQEISAYAESIKASQVPLTKERVAALSDRLDKAHVPADDPMRESVMVLMGLAETYGSKEIEPSPAPGPHSASLAEAEAGAKAMGFI